MFGLILLIAVANFALGYGAAVYVGWAKWPQWKKTDAAPVEHAASHGH
jgi:hypothetical protein